MAYKFQLGAAILSGSVEVSDGLTIVDGDVSLPNEVINTSELSGSSVTTAKLADGNVTTAKLADLNVTRAKLEADAVDGSKLADDAVDSEHIAADAIDTEHIADAQVTNAKLANSSVMFNGVSVALGATGSFSTTAVSEGTNLYYTDARARAAVSIVDAGGDGSFTYNSGSGVFTYTGPSESEVRAHLSAGDGLSYASGQFAVTSSIAGDGLIWNAGVLSVDASELIGDLDSVIDAHLSGSGFVTYTSGVIGVNAAAFTADVRDEVSAANGAASDSGSLAYNSATGVFTLSPASPSWAKGLFSAGAGLDYADGVFSVGTGEVTNAMLSGGISNDKLVNNTISGKALGTNLDTLTSASNSGLASFTYNGSGPAQIGLHASVAGNGLGYNLGVINVNTTGAMGIISDKLIVQASLAGTGITATSNGTDGLTQMAVSYGSVGGTAVQGNTQITFAGAADEITIDAGATQTLGAGGSVTIGLADTISGTRTFTGDVTINNLNVTGTLTTINTTNLEVKDARILMASGSTGWATDVGFDFGSHAGHGTLLTADVNIDGAPGAENVLSSSLPLVAPSMMAATFYGSLVGSATEAIQSVSSNASSDGSAIVMASAAGGDITFTLPAASGWTGRMMKIKKSEGSSNKVTVAAAGSDAIDGVADIQLVSPYAAIALVSNGSNWFIF